MSLGACIPGLIEDGTITQERGRRILKLYEELLAGYRRDMGGAAAEAAATEKTLEQLTREQALKKRRVGLAAATQRRMADDMASFRGGKEGGPIPARAAVSVLVHDDKAPYLSFEYLWKAVRGQAHALMDQVLVRHHGDVIGRVRDREGFERIVDELHGAKTGDLNAAEAADAARQAMEMLRLRANAAGADIGRLEDHGLPHSHDSEKVEAAGFADWRDVIAPLLDRGRLIDRATGQPFTDDALEPFLREVWETIRTDGWNKREPGSMGRPALANRLGEHRVLHFRDGAAWRAYNDRFGVGGAYDALMNHVDRMSRDIALMETLGPNPAAGLKWLQDSAEKAARVEGGAGERKAATKAGKQLQSIYDEAIGKNRDPYNRTVALAFSNLRAWQVSTKLGSAVLSTTSDAATIQLTKGFNGLPQSGTLRDYLRFLKPGNAEDQAHAIRSGLIAEEFAQRGSTSGRFLGEELQGEFAHRVAETTLKLSGLNAITQAGRWTFGRETISAMTLYRGLDYDGLNAGFRRMLDRYGIDAAKWDAIRATPITEERGAPWLNPTSIADQRLRDIVLGMIQAETDIAVPVGGLELNASVHSALRAGTIVGELGRTAFQFKAFPVFVTMRHAQRMMAVAGWKGRAGYVAALLGLTTIAGAAALQMKEIAKGKNPRPMDDGAFWLAAMAQGGGAGIYGDFLKGSQSRFGTSFTDVLKGPAWQTADTINALTLDALWDAADEDGGKVHYGRRVTKALRSEIPFGSLWFARAALERTLIDQLQQQIDPGYRRSWRMMERRAREQGNDYYWRPGELAPSAPDPGNAFGDAD